MAINWLLVKKDYEEDCLELDALANKYKCKPETIRRLSLKQCWKKKTGREKKREGNALAKTQKTTISPLEAEAGPSDIACGHRKLWKGVKKRLVRGLKSSDLKAGLEELKVAKVAGEVLTSVIKGERQAWGIAVTVEEKLDDTEDITREMASVTVSPGADEIVDGE